jgi:zinc protease
MRRFISWIACAAAIWTASPAFAMQVKLLPAVKGADVWFVEDHTVPIVAMEAAFPAGSAYDPPGKAGLADFAASMLDEGAGRLDSRAFHNALGDRAIQLSVAVDRDYFKITLVTETENVKDAFRLLALALQKSRFDSDAVTRVRAQLLQNIASEDEEPESVGTKAFYAMYFGTHPYAHAPGGDPQGINAILPSDLRSFARSHWVRRGLKIAVAGDTRPEAISALLSSAFGGLPPTVVAEPPVYARNVDLPLRVIAMTVPQPTAAFGLPGPLRSDPDFISTLVANYIVGGGSFSSRLTDEIRVKRGLTYDVSTDLLAFHKAGLIIGNVGTRKENIRQSIGVIREVLAKFAAGGATEQELSDAKTYLTGSFPLSFSSDAGTVSQLNTFQCEGLSPDYISTRNRLIESVTLNDIQRVAKRFFDPARLSVVIAGTPAESSPRSHH